MHIDPLSFLNENAYQTYNRHIARDLKSVNAAIMLSELVNRRHYHTEHNELNSHEKYGDGWFYLTIDKAEERTCLSRKEQDHGLNILKKHGLITAVHFGLPMKRYFKIHDDKVLEIFGLSKKLSNLSETAKLGKKVRKEIKENIIDCPKGTNYAVPKGQSAHIYKEPYKEPHIRTTTSLAVEDVHNIKKSENIQAAKEMQSSLEKKSSTWGDAWKIPISIFIKLIEMYNIPYVTDQIFHIVQQQNTALNDEKKLSSKNKTRRIDKPESYLRLACENNYALSDKSAKNSHTNGSKIS